MKPLPAKSGTSKLKKGSPFPLGSRFLWGQPFIYDLAEPQRPLV